MQVKPPLEVATILRKMAAILAFLESASGKLPSAAKGRVKFHFAASK